MSEKYNLLLLDDEQEILNALKRVLRKEFVIDTFTSGEDALASVAEKDYAIMISDMRMPVMDGATFLAKAKELRPDSVRILLTGYADMESTVKAINEGAIYCYLSKPWENEPLKVTINQALNHYLIKQENIRLQKELEIKNQALQQVNSQLEEKVKQRTQALSQTNSKLKHLLVNKRQTFQKLLDMVCLIIAERVGEAQGHHKRVAFHSKYLARELEMEAQDITSVYLAALMHEVGKVSIEDELLKCAENELHGGELDKFRHHAIEGERILSRLPSLEKVALMVRHQYERYDGSGYPDQLKGDEIPLGSRILSVVNDYDNLILGRKEKHPLTPEEATRYISEHKGVFYDTKVANAYLDLVKNLPQDENLAMDYCLTPQRLKPGMTLSKDLVTPAGGIILTQDTELTVSLIHKLKDYEDNVDYGLRVFVY